MPTRPRSHTLETESKAALASLMNSNNWVFEERINDYGIDGDIEIFKNERATGKFFNVQIKATDSLELSEILKISIDVESLDYLLDTERPTCLVRYSSYFKKFYFRSIQKATQPI